MAAPMVVRVLSSVKKVQICPIRNYMKFNAPKQYGGTDPILPYDRKMKRDEVREDLPTFAQVIKEKDLEMKQNERRPINIGLPHKVNRNKLRRMVRTSPTVEQLEQAARHRTLKIPLDEMRDAWLSEFGPIHKRQIAEHYGVFRDLLENAYFYPTVDLQVCYEYNEDLVTPVYTGNIIPPSDAQNAPNVSFEAEEDSLWTLVLTNPDSHLTDNDSEYLHWMVGNIRGSDMLSGDVLCEYLQPFPARATGFHRHVFVLFKQQKTIDYSTVKRPTKCTSLEERTFKLADFYEQYEDELTAVGLSFFQSEHDDSVTNVYHNILDMREPTFEYQNDQPYHPAQKRHPRKQPFDVFFDRYRDKKELNEEVMRMKMDMISPYQPYTPKYKYPLAVESNRDKPTWLQRKLNLATRRREQFQDLPQ